MSKRYYPLWNDATAFSNLLCAFRQAARGKRDRPAVVAFTLDLEEELLRLQAELRDGSYRPGAYVSFLIHEPKRRLISAAPWKVTGTSDVPVTSDGQSCGHSTPKETAKCRRGILNSLRTASITSIIAARTSGHLSRG